MQKNINDLDQKYDGLIGEIVKKTYSATVADLNEVIDGDLFKKVISDHLGFEVANFYFYDEDEGQLKFFHDAVDKGIEMPLYKITGKENGLFVSERVTGHDLESRRRQQNESLTGRFDPLTAKMCYDNLTTSSHRWSASERANDWILILEGEIITFSFEYLLRQRLAKSGIKTKAEALEVIEYSSIAKDCWGLMHNNPEYPHMKGRGDASLNHMRNWIKKTLYDRAKYLYLWEGSSEKKNWFINGSEELASLIDSTPHEDQYFRMLSSLIIRHSYPYRDDASPDIESSLFFERSRMSPHFELLHGTHNIVVFFIQLSLEDMPVQRKEPIKVVLLGTFYDYATFKKNKDKVRNIYSVATTRDFFRYSMTKLSSSMERIRKSEEILATISGSIFIHEFRKPIDLIGRHTEIIERRTKRLGYFNAISHNLAFIKMQVSKAGELIDTSREIAKLAFKPERKEIAMATAIPQMLESIKRTLPKETAIDLKIIDPNICAYANERSVNLVLNNLIRNANEAMPGKAQISIRVWQEDRQVKLSVADNGPGIKEKVLLRMFEVFNSSKEKGLGIGLYMCKNLLESQGGSIEAKNSEAGGAIFTISLKAVAAREAKI